MTDLSAARAAIRTEYMRGLPDAYNGSAGIRERTFARLMDSVDSYVELLSRTVDAAMTPAADASSDEPPTLSTTSPVQHNDAPAAKKTTTTRTRSRRRT